MKIPQHVAVILDGNGRWAKSKGMPRNYGHMQGAKNVEVICEEASKLGIKYLTVYAFSTENWNRPKEEVDALMVLLVDTIVKETPVLMKNNVRLQTIGDLSRLPQATRDKFVECISTTSQNTGLTMVVALSYSARWEMIQMVKQIATKVQNGELLIEDINEEMVSNHMATKQIPDPDLLIRTSGELRISNFLLWQLAYSELYFTDCLWPEFTNEEFYRAIVDYQRRERRFGKTSEQI